MARSASNDTPRDSQDALALWIAQRHGAYADYVRILNERENDLLALSEGQGPRSVPYRTAERELHDAEVQYNQIQKVIRRPLNKYGIRWRFFAAFALALALLEAPVNKYLFDVALQGSNFVSYSVAIAVAFFLLAVAHLAGKCLRQVWGEYRRKVIWSNVFLFLACATVIFAVISILTIGRASTSAEAALTGFGGIFSAVGSQIGSLGLWRTLTGAFSDVSALVLATVNLGGVFVAMLLAYFSHDPDKDFDAAAALRERKSDLLKAMHAAYVKKRRKIIAGYKPDLTGVSGTHGTASKAVVELKTRLGFSLDEDDRRVIDELDRLAEDSDHAEEAGVTEAAHAATEPTPLREFPRKAS